MKKSFCSAFLVLSLVVSSQASAIEEKTEVVAHDGTRLSGMWTLPEGEARGAALILQGAGNVGMDGDVSGDFVGRGYRGQPARLSEQLSKTLALAGVAALRFSKRGFEDSAQLANQVPSFLIKDAGSAFGELKKRFPKVPAVLVGFSEGALLAVHVAAEMKSEPPSALFLLGLPSRGIDETLAYQFRDWPVSLLSARLDKNENSVLESHEWEVLTDAQVPLLYPHGVAWKGLDLDGNSDLMLSREIAPAYESLFKNILQLAQTPAYKGWYEGMKNLTPLKEVGAKVTAPVYFYHGSEDAQTSPKWLQSDTAAFSGKTQVRILPGLGHCFAPMDGAIGEVKTSGPMTEGFLAILSKDILSIL